MNPNARYVRVSLVARVAGVDCRTMKKRIVEKNDELVRNGRRGIDTFQSGLRVLLVDEDDVIEHGLVDEAAMTEATNNWVPRRESESCKMK